VVDGVSDLGRWDRTNQRVRWGPFLDRKPRTFTYEATPLGGESGVKRFIALAGFDGVTVTLDREVPAAR
jgi:hypothetical protein